MSDTMIPCWDAAAASEKMDRSWPLGKQVRSQVYWNNNDIFAAGRYRTDTGKVIELPGAEDPMISGTCVYSEPAFLTGPAPFAKKELVTSVINDDCLRVARRMLSEGFHPAVLNLADARTACGGYPRGSRAQEESLCRTTTLSRSLYPYYSENQAEKVSVPFVRRAYPMDTRFGGIYSPDVTVFRENGNGYPLLDEIYKVSIISVAALNSRNRYERAYLTPDGDFTSEGMSIMQDKVRTIYRIASLHGHDALVLGAFGCGAFRLPSDRVAALFRDILSEEEFQGRFKAIRFAILEPGITDWHESRFAPFYEIFNTARAAMLYK